MSVAFVQTVTPWTSGGSSSPSGSFTAGTGNALIAGCINSGNVTNSVAGSLSTFSILTPPGQHLDAGNDLDVCAVALPAIAGSQTCTFSSSTAIRFGWLWEYSGASAVTALATDRSTPGTGSGAITGTGVTVPTGGILLALCVDVINAGAITSPTGTTRGSGALSGVNYCATEYSGTGATITPSFTSSAGSADSFVILQWLVSPVAGTFVLSVANGAYSLTGSAVTLTEVGSTFSLATAFGSYAITGKPQSFALGYKTAPNNGSFSILGQAQSFGFGSFVTLLANSGAYDYTGAGTSSDFSANAAVGVYALSGIPITLSGTFDNVLSAADGVYAFSGQSVTLTSITSSSLFVNTGSFLFNGVGQVLSSNSGGGGGGVGSGPVGVNGLGSQFVHLGRIN